MINMDILYSFLDLPQEYRAFDIEDDTSEALFLAIALQLLKPKKLAQRMKLVGCIYVNFCFRAFISGANR